MRKSSMILLVTLLVGGSSALAAHDLFLKLSDYFVPPHAEVRVTALNGTFTTSENTIIRARVADLSLAGPAGRESLDTTRISALGTRTLIRVRSGAPGTYVLGLSTRPSRLTLTGAEFGAYLKEEGLGQVLEARRAAGELGAPATEQYAKHVKVLFQAGGERSDSYGTVLGYPAEIVPLQNPYLLRPGDTLQVRLLVNGAPAPGLEALAGGRNPAGARLATQTLRADADGVAGLALRSAGTWYIKFISMTRAAEPGIDYVSQWATLTFALPRAQSAPPIESVLRGADGAELGRVILREQGERIQIHVRVAGLSRGRHGMHLHVVGSCEGPGFQSAGPHFDPGQQMKHGHLNPQGPHLGDLGNLIVGTDGRGEATVYLRGGEARAGLRRILGKAGIALILHADRDDERTDPSGNSGARIACAAIT